MNSLQLQYLPTKAYSQNKEQTTYLKNNAKSYRKFIKPKKLQNIKREEEESQTRKAKKEIL